RWRQPAALLAQTLAVNPRSWWAHEDYGRAELAAGHPEAAVLSLQRAAALSPGRFQAWHLLGMAATQLGRPEAAIAAFSSAVASAPLESGEFL
ncbi:tetratricopeptide repeat protein, partial [Klebsiella pneumoniae]